MDKGSIIDAAEEFIEQRAKTRQWVTNNIDFTAGEIKFIPLTKEQATEIKQQGKELRKAGWHIVGSITIEGKKGI